MGEKLPTSTGEFAGFLNHQQYHLTQQRTSPSPGFQVMSMRLMITPRKKIADTGRKSGSWGSYRICWPFWSSEKLEVGQLAVSLSSRSRKDFQGSRAPTNCLIRWVSTSRSPPDVLREMGLVPFSRQGLLFGTFNRMVVKHRYSCFKPLDCELGVTTTKVDLNSSRLPPVKTSSSEVLNVCVCVCVCVCCFFCWPF